MLFDSNGNYYYEKGNTFYRDKNYQEAVKNYLIASQKDHAHAM